MFGFLARLWGAPERNVLLYMSTGAQPKRSQNPKSPGVSDARDTLTWTILIWMTGAGITAT